MTTNKINQKSARKGRHVYESAEVHACLVALRAELQGARGLSWCDDFPLSEVISKALDNTPPGVEILIKEEQQRAESEVNARIERLRENAAKATTAQGDVFSGVGAIMDSALRDVMNERQLIERAAALGYERHPDDSEYWWNEATQELLGTEGMQAAIERANSASAVQS